MRRALPLLLAALLVTSACYRGADADLTETGKGRPDVVATAPPESSPGETVEAVIEVSNPGPGDMASVVVAFSRIGETMLSEWQKSAGAEGEAPGGAPQPGAVPVAGGDDRLLPPRPPRGRRRCVRRSPLPPPDPR